jgi:hypothetical protein
VPPIIRRQEDAISFVIGGDQETQDVEDVMLAQMFFIDAQHVRRCGGIDFRVVIERESVNSLALAEIPRFIDPQNDRLDEAVETAWRPATSRNTA